MTRSVFLSRAAAALSCAIAVNALVACSSTAEDPTQADPISATSPSPSDESSPSGTTSTAHIPSDRFVRYSAAATMGAPDPAASSSPDPTPSSSGSPAPAGSGSPTPSSSGDPTDSSSAPSAPSPTPAPAATGPSSPEPAPSNAGNQAVTPAATTVQPLAKTLKGLHGVNLSGAEFGSALPGTLNQTYTWPHNSEVDYYSGKGMNAYRIPFMWERLQPSAYGALDSTYAASLDSIIAYATAKGDNVILNPQNWARYYNNLIGTSAVPNGVFANFWARVAARYAKNPHVIFGLMNEPYGLPTENWASAANAAIAAIRSTGATNLVTVPGVDWTNAYSWYDTSYGTPNAVAMLTVHDSGNNMIFEVHNYMYPWGSGTDQCASTTVGSDRLAPFIKWLRANGKRGIIGETAGGPNATCYAAVKNELTTMAANSDVLAGWLWWGGGPWWPSNYPFLLDPINGVDRPQMSVIKPFLY